MWKFSPCFFSSLLVLSNLLGRSVGNDNDNFFSSYRVEARRAMQQPQRSLHLDRAGKTAEAAARQLNMLGVDRFCSDLSDIELFLTEEIGIMTNETVDDLSTESGMYECTCDVTDPDLTLVCGAMEQFDPQEPPTVNVEVMVFDLMNTTMYHPLSVNWCQYFEGSFQGQYYCENFAFDPMDSMKLDSCFVEDSACINGTIFCEVCPDGQSVSLSSECFLEGNSITCDMEYRGSFLYAYHLENPIEIAADIPTTNCSHELSAEDFCNNIHFVEEFLEEAWNLTLPDFPLLSPWNCTCMEADIECGAFYFDIVSNMTSLNTERMTFREDGNDWVPYIMEWCYVPVEQEDGVPACDYFEFGYGQEDLFFCNLDGCDAGFCELCSDGLTVGHSCQSNATCSDQTDDNYLGSLFFPYKDLRLAINQCPPTEFPTVSPTANPETSSPSAATSSPSSATSAPSLGETPAPTSAPTSAPSKAPAAAITLNPTPSPTAGEGSGAATRSFYFSTALVVALSMFFV